MSWIAINMFLPVFSSSWRASCSSRSFCCCSAILTSCSSCSICCCRGLLPLMGGVPPNGGMSTARTAGLETRRRKLAAWLGLGLGSPGEAAAFLPWRKRCTKKASCEIRSLALRRNKHSSRSLKSGETPFGIL